MAKIIFALMGPSGCGKSRLVADMLTRFPDALLQMRSLTTRPSRGPEEDAAYAFVSRERFISLRDADALVQYVEFNGNFYGDKISHVESIFAAGRQAIRPMVADGIRNFRAAGYRVAVAHIIPEGDGYKNRSATRKKLDAARLKDTSVADLDIVNSFAPGGYERAADALAAYIRGYLAGSADRCK